MWGALAHLLRTAASTDKRLWLRGSWWSSPVLILPPSLRGIDGELWNLWSFLLGGGGAQKGRWERMHTCQLSESSFRFDVFLHLRVIGGEIHPLQQVDEDPTRLHYSNSSQARYFGLGQDPRFHASLNLYPNRLVYHGCVSGPPVCCLGPARHTEEENPVSKPPLLD